MNSGALVATLTHFVLALGALAVFPLVAVFVKERKGSRALAMITGMALAILSLAALCMGTEAFGNRSSQPLALRASRTLLMYELSLGLPILAAAAVVQVMGSGRNPALTCAAAVSAALVTWIAASIAAVYLFAAIL